MNILKTTGERLAGVAALMLVSVAGLLTWRQTQEATLSEPEFAEVVTTVEQDAARLAEALRKTQPPARPASDTLCSDALPSDIYDEFNKRYAAWVASVVKSGDLTPLHDNHIIVLEPGHGPVLASFVRTDCRDSSHVETGMHFTGRMQLMVVNRDGSHQLFDDMTGYPAQTPPPYAWIGDRFVLLVTLDEPFVANEVPVEVWHVMATDDNWQLQKHSLPDTPFFSAPRAASGELQLQEQTHSVLGRVLLQDVEPPCEFKPDSPFVAGGLWEDQRAFMFLEGEYQLWESHRVYSTFGPGGERFENLTAHCVETAAVTPEVIATDPPPAVMMPVTPTLTVDQPSPGEHLAIARPFTVSGRLVPSPIEETLVTLLVMVEGGTHPNFDFVTVDSETGEWVIETHLHPQHVGEAELLIAHSSGPEIQFDSGGTVTLPVTLVYDEADELAYVNLTTPLELTVVAQPGDEVVIQGSAHNPIDGMVWLHVREEGVSDPVLFDESAVDENGLWEIVVPISADWVGKGSLLTEACTGTQGAPGVAWCSTLFLTVE